jgi:hypothetical protein
MDELDDVMAHYYVKVRDASSMVERVTYGFRVHLMSQNSPSPMALHSHRLPILGRLQSIYTLHNKLQSIYLLPSILDINHN